MTRLAVAVDRLVALVVGLVLLAGGAGAALWQLDLVPFPHDGMQDVVLIWRGGTGVDTLRILTMKSDQKVICRSNKALDLTFKDAARKLVDGETLGARLDAEVVAGQLVVTRGIMTRNDKACCSGGKARVFMKMPDTGIALDKVERLP